MQAVKKEIKDDFRLSREQILAMYQSMVFYRRFEERVLLSYTKQKFSGFCHVHIGQEAVCVGVQQALVPTDYMISGYRSHTQAVAKGIPPEQVFSELFGKVSGCSRGKGGSMHCFSDEKRFLGGHGIVGGQAPIAVGVGFKIKFKKERDVCVCYLGDAAMNQGQVFEAMNMAATWDLPVLFIIENNRYGMGTDIRRTTSVDKLAKRAKAFDMKHETADGMNVLNVYNAAAPVIERMREDKKPFLLELMTYRYKGHSVSDPATYRAKSEVEQFQKKDPILQLKDLIVKKKWASDEELKNWDKDAKDKVKKAEKFADDAPQPDPEELYMHVFAE